MPEALNQKGITLLFFFFSSILEAIVSQEISGGDTSKSLNFS